MLLERVGVTALVAASVDLGVIARSARAALRPLPLFGARLWRNLVRMRRRSSSSNGSRERSWALAANPHLQLINSPPPPVMGH